MFNALESIRMHSLLKGETETATMVDKLAVMERQNVEWGKDYVSVKTEIESIEAYLALHLKHLLQFELKIYRLAHYLVLDLIL